MSGKRREDRAQRTTYNSLSVFGITGKGNEGTGRAAVGSKRDRGNLRVYVGVYVMSALSGRQERRLSHHSSR